MSGEKTPAPELRPCPFCGGPAVLREFGFDYRVGAKDVRVGCAVAFTPRGDFGDAHVRCPVAPILYSLMAPKGVDIVAAWNRRAEPERPGNAALLRAALKDVLDHAPFATDHATMLTGGNDLLTRLRHAYYAPARNCDRFADVLRASEAYEATRTDLPFEEWLFSTEKEKETDNG